MNKPTCGFAAYFRSLRLLPQPKRLRNVFIPLIYCFLFSFMLATLCHSGAVTSLFLGCGAFFCSMPLLWANDSKPNICALVPVSSGRRAAYSLLSVITMFVFFELYILVFTLVINLPAFLLVLIKGGSVLSFYSDMYLFGYTAFFQSAYSALISVSLILYVLGAGLVYANTDGEKRRNIIAIIMFAAAEIGTVILSFAAEGRVFGNALSSLSNLSAPYLAVILIGICGLASFGYGVFLVIKKNRPKRY